MSAKARPKQATGAASIPGLTASGTAKVHRAASGTPSIAAIEASGTATVMKVATGAAILAAIEAAGTALVRKQASGSASIAAIVAAGTGATTTDESWALRVLGSGVAYFAGQIGGNPGDCVEGVVLVNDGEWHHIMAVRDSNTYRLFADGVADGTTAISGSLNFFTEVICVGAAYHRVGFGVQSHLVADITGVRVFKGTAQETSGFTPPKHAYCT